MKVTALKIRQRSAIRSLALIFIMISCIGLALGDMRISGVGSGELLLNFTIQDAASVLDGSYNYDLVGIYIPPMRASTIHKGQSMLNPFEV